MIVIDINTDATVKFTNKLEKLSKTALPNVIRQTLNKAALDVKQVTMLKTSSSEFVNRQKNFFKATSRVQFASGNNIASMQSMVGFSDRNLSSGNKQAIEDLEQQEKGGTISGRSFIPLKSARSGNNNGKLVRANARLKNVKNVINAHTTKFKGHARNKKQKFVRAAIKAFELYGNEGFVLGNYFRGQQTLSRIDDISPTGVNGTGIKIKRTPVYSYKKGRHAVVKGTGFMKRASFETSMKMDYFYIQEARKIIEKALQ